MVRTGASSALSSFNKRVGMLSGPADLWISRLSIRHFTPWALIEIDVMSGIADSFKVGKGVLELVVKLKRNSC